MSVAYKAVGWNRNKLIYDAVAVAAIFGFVETFIQLAPAFAPAGPPLDDQAVHMRAWGGCAFLLTSLALCIGPLARLDARFLPLLYNRRHLGVMTALVALAHASYVLGWYFGFSPVDPYVALLSSNTSYTRIAGFPFEVFGVAALLILGVLASTSHDFWLAFLTPPLWKAIHISIYAAYALVVAHVALGAMTMPYNGPLAIVVGGGVLCVACLHLAAAAIGARADAPAQPSDDGWLDVGDPSSIRDGRAVVVPVASGESIAVFRDKDSFSAIANACAHQNGPLGEGRIVDGCVTCPWHGYQYRPEDGVSPPPFTEKVATYRLRLEGGLLQVDPRPNAPGAFVPPLLVPGGAA